MKNFLTDEECEYIKKKAEKNLQTSTIGSDYKVDERIRKSETAWLSKRDQYIRFFRLGCVFFPFFIRIDILSIFECIF